MINIEKTEVFGWDAAIRGMRNPMNSWEKSDSEFEFDIYDSESEFVRSEPYAVPVIGDNDHDLMMRLARGGAVHAKYRRMITVTCDITAPLYWWKEFDTYKVGTVANSCSTMHKIHDKEFTVDDFSHEHLHGVDEHPIRLCFNSKKPPEPFYSSSMGCLEITVAILNYYRERFLETKGKDDWHQMIQLLPTSYNQKRTVMLNYEVLVGMYRDRKNHKLDEWRTFCEFIQTLPYSEIITVVTDEVQQLKEENLHLRADLEATIAGQLTLQKALAKFQNGEGVTH